MGKLYCHLCDQETSFVIKEEKFNYQVRNDGFLIKGKKTFCEIHPEEELFHKKYDIDNQENAFQLYREKHGITGPEEIKEIRKKYHLSQREYSRLLGFGEITIARYERGSLPTIAQSQMIKDSEDPNKMMELLEQNAEKIDHKKAIETKDILNGFLNVNIYEQEIINEIKEIFHHKSDEYSGYKEFNMEKFSHMTAFFSEKERPYLTKLNKLMFYADYYFFQKYEMSMSGVKYMRDYYGPVPVKFRTLYDNIGHIEINENEMGSFTILKKGINLDQVFTEQELEILQFVHEKFKRLYSSEMKDYSHEEKCWVETPNKQNISYLYAKHLDMDRDVSRQRK